MALKCIQIDHKFQVPNGGFYQIIIPTYDIQSVYLNVYDNIGILIQTINRVCNHVFYFTSGEVISFKGSIVLEEHTKFKFNISRIGSSEEDNKDTTVQQCVHEWEEYIGIINRFTYCSKCDVKGE